MVDEREKRRRDRGKEVRGNGRIQGCFVSILRLCMR